MSDTKCSGCEHYAEAPLWMSTGGSCNLKLPPWIEDAMESAIRRHSDSVEFFFVRLRSVGPDDSCSLGRPR